MNYPLFTLQTSAAHYGSDTAAGADRGHSSQCLCLYQPRHSTFQKRSRSGSSLCFAKDTRLHLLQLKLMTSAVAAICINLPTSVAMTYHERKKLHFSRMEMPSGNVTGNAVISQ